MEFRRLGNTGLRVSTTGLGCNNFSTRCDFDASRKVVHKALDLGISLFDTSDSYGRGGSEDYLGQILGPRRADVVLATKFSQPMGEGELMKGASRRYIMRAVEASLQRLRTDWIDLYQLHFQTRRHRSRRLRGRSTISSIKARCATSVAPISSPGKWSRRSGPLARPA